MKKSLLITLASLSLLAGGSVASAQYYGEPNPQMSSQQPGQGSVEMRQGQCFSYAVPAGWRVVEEGQFAVVLMSQDNNAMTMTVGNTGLPENTDPMQFAQAKLAQLRVSNLQFGQARQAQPANGCSVAWEFEIVYVADGIPCRGVAKVSAAPIYGMTSMVLNCAASAEAQWGSYASWLPQVACATSASHGGAFDARGTARSALNDSIEIGNVARVNREHSERVWGEVVRGRNESNDRNNHDFRHALGGVTEYNNPYTGRTEELTNTNSVYWINRQTGAIVGNPNSTFDPRTPTDAYWERMQPTPYGR